MSVLITVKLTGDVGAFRRALDERSEDFARIGERAKGAGALHHRFGAGDGYILIVDEWESAEGFEKFFSDPELQTFIGEAGGDPSGRPDITVAEAISSGDEF